MSDAPERFWSSNPYAPQISSQVYFAEKMACAGHFMGGICYGIIIVLFFKCMSTLLNPVRRSGRGIRWGLMGHTVAMFSLATIYTAVFFHLQSFSYIDNREFPGFPDGPPAGPFGYQFYISNEGIVIVYGAMFQLNQWLADGLLLYRCHVLYATNYWVIALPCLMYLASLAMGTGFIYEIALPVSSNPNVVTQVDFGIAYFSVSISLNVLLTMMIVTRLVVHSKNFRKALGTAAGAGGLYKSIVTILVESCALYTVSYLLYIGPWAAGNPAANAFSLVRVEAQVIAPFLITLRVADRTEVTSDAILTGNMSSIEFGSQAGSQESETSPDESFVGMTGVGGEATYNQGVGVENTIDEVPP